MVRSGNQAATIRGCKITWIKYRIYGPLRENKKKRDTVFNLHTLYSCSIHEQLT